MTVDKVLADFADDVGESGPVAVEGSRTRWSTGGAPEDGVRLVHAPTGVMAYRPEEMTVCVRAGTTVCELHSLLAESGQRTALPERGGTVGGALAVGEDAVDVLGRGAVRSCLLQVSYVAADGRVVKGGGPTVKNVSGFDLPRLMVGAMGTLGLLAEVILRTNPIPEVTRWWASDDADPFGTLASVYGPSAVLWDGARTWVCLEGHAPDVDAQRSVLEQHGHWSPASEPPSLPEHRWSLRPADLRSMDRHDTGPFVASIGVGTVFASNPQPPRVMSAELRSLHARMKTQFDPTGRLNPGRDPSMT